MNPTDEDKMRKLGDRLRSGWAQEHPVSQKSLQSVREGVSEQFARDQQQAKQAQPAKPPPKSRGMDR
jgi:hypothetical protein